MEDAVILTIIGLFTTPIYVLMFYFLKKLNYTCNIITQLVTFSKLIHPEESKGIFDTK